MLPTVSLPHRTRHKQPSITNIPTGHSVYSTTYTVSTAMKHNSWEKTRCTDSKQIHYLHYSKGKKCCFRWTTAKHVSTSQKVCVYILSTAVDSELLYALRFHSTPYDTHCLCSHPVCYKQRISQTVPPLAQTCLYLADSPRSISPVILWPT